MMAISSDKFRAAMRCFPGVVTIVTTSNSADPLGITATAFSSVTADPPSVLVCLGRATGTCNVVEETGQFNVNLLASQHGDLAMRFGGAHQVTGPDKFTQGKWDTDKRGLPVLRDALVSLSCDVSEVVETSSHAVFIGQINDATIREGQPLLFEKSAFRGLGPLAD